MIRYRTKSYTRSSNGPLIVVMKTEAEYKPCSRHFVVLHFTELVANLSCISPHILHNLWLSEASVAATSLIFSAAMLLLADFRKLKSAVLKWL
jgi:hypothetical protein